MPRPVRPATTPDETVRTLPCDGDRTLRQIQLTVGDTQRLLRALTLPAARDRPTGRGRRRRCVSAQPQPPVIRTPRDVWDLLGEEMSALVQEQLRVLLITAKGGVLGCELVYQGTVHGIAIRAAEVLRPAVLANAPSIVVAHNHPSGEPEPSPEDVRTTELLVAAGELLDVAVLDHVVLGRGGRYVSLRERGLVSGPRGPAIAIAA